MFSILVVAIVLFAVLSIFVTDANVKKGVVAACIVCIVVFLVLILLNVLGVSIPQIGVIR